MNSIFKQVIFEYISVKRVYYFILIILMGLNYANADYDNYTIMYNTSEYFDYDFFDFSSAYHYGYSRDLGYALINKLFLNIGFSFQEFKFVITVVLLMLIIYISSKLTNKTWIVMGTYVLYPYFMDIIQIRNFIIEVALFVAIYIYSQQAKGNIAMYIFLLLIAATIHSAALVYLFYLIIEYMRLNKNLKYIYYVLLLLGILTPIYASIISDNVTFLNVLLLMNGNIEHFTQYFSKTMNYGYLVPYIYITITTLIVKYMYIDVAEKVTNKQLLYIRAIYYMMLYMCILLPLFAINGNMIRIPRNLMLTVYLVLAIYLQTKNKYINKIFCVIVICILSFFLGCADLYIPETTAYNTMMILTNNFLLDVFF